MTALKTYWWKILAVLIILYVLCMGFLVPLNPGIYNFTPSTATEGEIFEVEILGYNTHFTTKGTRAWIKLPNDSLVRAKELKARDDQRLQAVFQIPSPLDIPSSGGIMASIIVDNERDGYALYPQGIRIRPMDSGEEIKAELYGVEVLHQREGFAYPFRNILYETIRNTFFHVAIWFAMFILLICSCIYSGLYLYNSNYDHDLRSTALTSTALWFGIAGLLTGSMWAKYTWGTFWTSDIKLNMTAVALLIYFAYWILRRSVSDVDARARIASVYNIFAFICLLILVMVIPRLTDSLHPGNGGNPALGGEDLDNTLRTVFYPAIIGYTLLGLWIAELYYRVSRIDMECRIQQ